MENVKEKLTKAIEIIVQKGISKEPGAARFMAERIVLLIADFVKQITPGATGAFPEGKLDEHDQGQLRMLVSHDEKNVRLDFGKSVAWIAMPTNEALTIAFAILEHCGVVIEHKVMQNPAKGEGA